MIQGNLTGLKPSQIKALERIGRRRIPAGQLITGELARYLCERSRELGRQLGILVDRLGTVIHVIVGDDREIVIPDLSAYGLGRSGLRGLRVIHTHLKGEPLSQDDLTDLALLRLDLMVALGVGGDGLPGRVYYAHLLPPGPEGRHVEVLSAPSVYALDLDLESFLRSLEGELERKMAETVDLTDTREKAILLSVSTRSRQEIEDALDELTELARTADVVVLDRVVQRPRRINPKYLMGQGKIKEVVIRALQQGASLLIFDQDLTAVQVRSISALTEMKVIDRTQLILDIFAQHARTRDGKLQVELAQLRYRLPRLAQRADVSLSRLAGGIGGRGPGETKLEVDRRRTRDRVRRLERELAALGVQREERRRRRNRRDVPVLSIVGYTNAGKSTLLRALTRSEVHIEDKMFATLDPTSRRLRFPREREVIITDTVGFIRDLPPDLVAAFRATLEELGDANLLLHVIDAAAPDFERRIAAVREVLAEIGRGDTPELLVFNQVDRLPVGVGRALARRFGGVPVSALQGAGLRQLLIEAERMLWREEMSDEPRSRSLSLAAEGG
jgi:GTP-binding protein HflX